MDRPVKNHVSQHIMTLSTVLAGPNVWTNKGLYFEKEFFMSFNRSFEHWRSFRTTKSYTACCWVRRYPHELSPKDMSFPPSSVDHISWYIPWLAVAISLSMCGHQNRCLAWLCILQMSMWLQWSYWRIWLLNDHHSTPFVDCVMNWICQSFLVVDLLVLAKVSWPYFDSNIFTLWIWRSLVVLNASISGVNLWSSLKYKSSPDILVISY